MGRTCVANLQEQPFDSSIQRAGCRAINERNLDDPAPKQSTLSRTNHAWALNARRRNSPRTSVSAWRSSRNGWGPRVLASTSTDEASKHQRMSSQGANPLHHVDAEMEV